ncbi:MAG: S1C family serine protease [Patescibacteria group bacterium]
MKPKIVPTSPKGKAESEALDGLYSRKKLSELEKPLRIKLGWSLSLSLIILAFITGLLGVVVFDWLIYQTPHWGLWQRLNIATTSTSTPVISTATNKLPSGQDWNEAQQKAVKSIVSIYNKKEGATVWDLVYDPAGALGYGILLSTDGLIITTDDVIVGNGDQVIAKDNDGKIYPIDSVIDDPVTDFTFLTIEAKGLSAAQYVTRDQLEITQPLLRLIPMTVADIVAELVYIADTQYNNTVFRSSEKINNTVYTTDNNPSTGQIFINSRGDIIGLANTAGLVVPLYHITPILKTVLSEGIVERPRLGINYLDVATAGLTESFDQSQSNGILLTNGPGEEQSAIVANSPAEEAELLAGDVIVAVDDEILNHHNDFTEIIQSYSIGEVVNLKIYRDGAEQTIRASLEKVSK